MPDFDIELASGLDMSLPVSEVQARMFSRVDDSIRSAKEFQNMQPVWNAAIGLSQFTRASGLSLAKLFHDGLQVWEDLGLGTEEEYYEEAYIKAGKHKQTVKRYTSIWGMFADENVPGRYRDEVMALGVKALAPIAQMVKEGHAIEDNQWLALAHATDEAEVRRIKKEITGKKDNPNSLSIFIDSDGDITITTGRGRTVFVGYLRVKDDDADLQRAIERIKNASRMIEK